MFADNMILCIENPKMFTKQKVLEVIKGFSDVAKCTCKSKISSIFHSSIKCWNEVRKAI